jgi:PBSX family phage terminase large subunit
MSTAVFKKTLTQEKATFLMASEATHIMSYGGSRSGKTFNIIRAIIIRASKTRSRHVILRLNFNHCKTSIWLDTLPKVLRVCFPDLLVTWNKSDYFLTLPNGSEIWIGGLDDDKRVEKILGKEYSTIFFNECSQISWSSIQVALTRLAEKSDLKNKAYYDENPPTKRHWSYWIFVKKINPDTGEALESDNYASILMNPNDNIDNIDENYLKILNSLDEKQRNRFLLGEFNDDSDGQAYYSFNRDVNVRDIDSSIKQGTQLVGMDFNVMPMTAVCCYYINKTFYIVDEVFLENSDTFKMATELKGRGYRGSRIYPDSTGANRKTSGRSDHAILKEDGFVVVDTRNPFVTDRVNNVNRLLRDGKIVIDPKCKKLINDLEKVTWRNDDLDQKTDKMLTHISDALGYLCHAIDPLIGLPQKSSTVRL